MQTDNKFFDDMAKLGQSAVGTLHGMKGELEALIRVRLESMLRGMDLVSREEFLVVEAMAKAARLENESLKKRLSALEEKQNEKNGIKPRQKSKDTKL